MFYQSVLFICFIILAAAIACASPLPDPAGLAPGTVYHRVFVTSQTFVVTNNVSDPPNTLPLAGEIGGIRSADYWATSAAFAGGLLPNWNGISLDYVAILSDSTHDARDRLDVQGPIYNMQNELIATSAADLWDSSIANAIRYDEFRVVVAEGSRAWTGSDTSGQASETGGDWTNPNDFGRAGVPWSTSSDWSSAFILSTDLHEHLYAFSPPLTVVPEPSSFALAAVGLLGLAAWLRRANSDLCFR